MAADEQNSGESKRSSAGSSSFDYIEPDEDELNEKLFQHGLSLLKEHYAESPLRVQVEALAGKWKTRFGKSGSLFSGNRKSQKEGRSNASKQIGELD